MANLLTLTLAVAVAAMAVLCFKENVGYKYPRTALGDVA